MDVQSDLLSGLETRLVIPLLRSEELGKRSIRNLNPLVGVNGEVHFAMTQQMAAIPKVVLGDPIETVEFSRREILSSIDFLITGI